MDLMEVEMLMKLKGLTSISAWITSMNLILNFYKFLTFGHFGVDIMLRQPCVLVSTI